MPTTGNVHVAAARERRPGRFDAERLRQLARTPDARERLRRQRIEERARARSVAAARREQVEDRRILLSEMAGEAAQARQNARAAQLGVRADPAYGLWRAWAPRVDRGTLYDARTWRRTGRLVPIGEHMRYQGGGRREVIDWTAALDREAQQVGMDVRDLPAHFERLRRQEDHARQLSRVADERLTEYSEMRSLLREAS